MTQLVILGLVVTSFVLFAVGFGLGGPRAVRLPRLPALSASIGIVAAAVEIRHRIADWTAEMRLRYARDKESELAAAQTPNLFGEYTPYVVEAAGRLGEARDATAVPALMTALERCANLQRPGWSERAEALSRSLGRIGDRRALPLLYRLENVRGIGFISAVRGAIAEIEPQSSLLRPDTGRYPPEILLRPAHDVDAELRAASLLRVSEKE